METINLDTYEGDGCFVVPVRKTKAHKINENECLLGDTIVSFAELERVSGHRSKYDNHQDLININGCIGYIPVLCTKIEKNKSGKSLVASFLDMAGSFNMLAKGKRLINNRWIDFNHKFTANKAYVLKCKSNPDYPDELEILDYRELKPTK